MDVDVDDEARDGGHHLQARRRTSSVAPWTFCWDVVALAKIQRKGSVDRLAGRPFGVERKDRRYPQHRMCLNTSSHRLDAIVHRNALAAWPLLGGLREVEHHVRTIARSEGLYAPLPVRKPMRA